MMMMTTISLLSFSCYKHQVVHEMHIWFFSLCSVCRCVKLMYLRYIRVHCIFIIKVFEIKKNVFYQYEFWLNLMMQSSSPVWECWIEVFSRVHSSPLYAQVNSLVVDSICGRVYCIVCRGVELGTEQVRSWYENRACEIEQLSGQVDGALQLVKLAIDKSVEVVSLSLC